MFWEISGAYGCSGRWGFAWDAHCGTDCAGAIHRRFSKATRDDTPVGKTAMTDVKQPGMRGRPRDPAKQVALLDAARELFLQHGPEATMDQMVAHAKVSRTTLYANFPDKGALIEAMFARESRRIVSEEFAAASLSIPLEQALTGFGERFVSFLSNPETLSFERLIASFAAAHPTLAPRFFAAGPGRAHDILRRIIAQACDRGEIAVDDLDAAVSDLIGLWQGFRRVEQSFGQRPPYQGDELQRFVARCVAMFFRMYGAPAAE